MKTFFEREAVITDVTNVFCNYCGRNIQKDTNGYFEDHISISKDWGYHSQYDGESHHIDLCANCYEGWISEFQIPLESHYTEYVWEQA